VLRGEVEVRSRQAGPSWAESAPRQQGQGSLASRESPRRESRKQSGWPLSREPEQQGPRVPSKGRRPCAGPAGGIPPLVAVVIGVQLAYDCWNLLQSRKARCRRPVSYLPRATRSFPLLRQRIESGPADGFLRDALRTCMAGMLILSWSPRALPSERVGLRRCAVMSSARRTDLCVVPWFVVPICSVLARMRCLLWCWPPEHRWPSEGHRLDCASPVLRCALPAAAGLLVRAYGPCWTGHRPISAGGAPRSSGGRQDRGAAGRRGTMT